MKHLFLLILLTISSSVLSQKIFNVYDSFTLELVDSIAVTGDDKKIIVTRMEKGVYWVESAENGTKITFTHKNYETQFFYCPNANSESYSVILVPTATLLKAHKAKHSFYGSFAMTSAEKALISSDSVSTFSEQPAQFPGGQSELAKFLSNTIQYPQLAVELNISGKVYVQFVVRTTGEISNVKVVKSVNYLMDAESVRVIKAMPNWVPGSSNGKPVNTFFNLPISFKMY
ncbi:MAG: energy transducer TonB [Flavobacteriia bacterium]|nr:energy transducer TonB [Flavobacteriia bacterium]